MKKIITIIVTILFPVWIVPCMIIYSLKAIFEGLYDGISYVLWDKYEGIFRKRNTK